MKILVTYFSRTGNTKKVGKKIAKKLNADKDEIKDNKKRSGPIGFIKSGKEAMSKTIVAIHHSKDPSKYDLVIIGTPVWAGNMSSPVRSYISKHKDKFNKVAFFCTTGAIGIEKCLNKMQELAEKKPISTLGLTTKELDNQEKIKRFAKELKQ